MVLDKTDIRYSQIERYNVVKEGDHEVYEGRYWNVETVGISIVASLTRRDGYIIDWAAYIGATFTDTCEETALYAAEYGNKLTKKEAAFYFPDIMAIAPYRL